MAHTQLKNVGARNMNYLFEPPNMYPTTSFPYKFKHL